MKIKTILIIVVLAVVFFAVAGTVGRLYRAWDTITTSPKGEQPVEPLEEPAEDAFPEIMTVLLLGTDQREDGPARADTLMLLTLHRESGKINLVSIPRDMQVNIPRRGPEKVSHAYAHGGISLAMQTVEEFLEIEIDHYVWTNLNGFENIVDALGGVELEVEKKMRYHATDVTIELDPGLQRLCGNKALQYVRYRSDRQGDWGRVSRQQKLLAAMFKEAYSLRTVWQAPRLLTELAEFVRTDLGLLEAKNLAGTLQNIALNGIETVTLPGKASSSNGISYIEPDMVKIREIIATIIAR